MVAQTEDEEASSRGKKNKGFHMGLNVGAYLPNGQTAGTYDGYGYDFNGIKNDFLNSLMYKRIVYDYGGGYGQVDLIAQELHVNHGEWTFNEGNMPQNLYYSPGIMVGINFTYKLNSTQALIFNANGAQLTINGAFQIGLNTPPPYSQSPGYLNYQTFAIKAVEQRAIFQLGYQHIIPNENKNNKINFFYEGGAVSTLTKLKSEQILINQLLIDLPNSINLPGYAVTAPQNKVGIGIGVFGGLGINISTNTKWSAQLLYTPSYENLYYGDSPQFLFQQAISFRAMR